MSFRPDPTFYPSPRLAMQAPSERLAYVASLNPNGSHEPDDITVVDLEAAQDVRPNCRPCDYVAAERRITSFRLECL